MPDGKHWWHDRDHILMLQNAHAKRIEAEYRDEARLHPGHVDIRTVEGVPTFYSRDSGFHNRALLTGDETAPQIDAVLQHFTDKNAECWIELNPANFYSTEWQSKILPHLLQRSCVINSFRAVWVRDRPLGPDEQAFSRDCRRVENDIVYEQSMIEGGEMDEEEAAVPELPAGPGFFFYVGYHQERPVAWTSMYCDGESGYLMNADTHNDFLRQGYHGQMIRLRVREAFEMGAQWVFTHTEFNSTSARNQQRNGFQLAYNYLLLDRPPKPLN